MLNYSKQKLQDLKKKTDQKYNIDRWILYFSKTKP